MSGERRHHQAEFENPDTVPDESGRFTAASTSVRRRHFGLVPMEVAPPRATRPWQRGSRIDRYELVEEIAAGGMSVVWSARDVVLGRDVAVKLIRSGGWPREAQRDHLLAEARAMARLSHRNVVTVYDVGTTDLGLFIAMERMDGGSLRAWLEAAPRSWRAVVAKFIAAGRGLAEAHRAGLVHRDFKPDNVLIGADGVARVSDFGLALPLRTPRNSERGAIGQRGVTQSGGIAGTLAYMAPEQLIGDKVTARSDQFSFCVALYEALYGVRPFGAATDEAPAAILLARGAKDLLLAPPPDRNVPGPFHPVILRGLARDPNDRWPSLDALLAELEGHLQTSRNLARQLALGGHDGTTVAPRSRPTSRTDSPRGQRPETTPGERPQSRPRFERSSMAGETQRVRGRVRFGAPAISARAFGARPVEIFLGVGLALVVLAIALLISPRLEEPAARPPMRRATLEVPVPGTPTSPVVIEKREVAQSAPPDASKMASVRVVSRPAGEVNLVGGGVLCKTPCTLSFMVEPDDIGSSQRSVFVVRSPGYEEVAISIDLASPQREVRVALKKLGG